MVSEHRMHVPYKTVKRVRYKPVPVQVLLPLNLYKAEVVARSKTLLLYLFYNISTIVSSSKDVETFINHNGSWSFPGAVQLPKGRPFLPVNVVHFTFFNTFIVLVGAANNINHSFSISILKSKYAPGMADWWQAFVIFWAQIKLEHSVRVLVCSFV